MTYMGSRLLSDPVMSMLKNKISFYMVGLARLELATPSLSGTYSNHLSYKPKMIQGNDIKLVKFDSKNKKGTKQKFDRIKFFRTGSFKRR